MKTQRSAAKRFKVTGTGKLKRFKAAKSHLLTKKKAKRKRSLRKPGVVSQAEIRRMKRLIPYAL